MNTTDNILISIIVGTAAVGIYSNYFMIQNKIYCVKLQFPKRILPKQQNLCNR